MILFIKNIIAKKLIKIIDLKLSYSVKPELFRLHQLIKDFDRSQIFGTILKGINVNIDVSAILIVKENSLVKFEGENYIGRNVEIQPDNYIKIGYGTSIQDRNIILGDVQIGRYCLTAPNVYMSSGNHFYDIEPEDYIKNQDQKILAQNNQSILINPIVIEDDVWIGINSVIMRGVRIGKGAIVGSNSVVTKSVDPYTVVVGNPAKELKKRIIFSPKKELIFSNFKDIPYFYSGFLLDQQNLEKSSLLGGVYASSKFTICVDTNSCNFVELILKNNSNTIFLLQLNDQIEELNKADFFSVVFKINQKEQLVNFKLLNADEEYFPYLLIKSIRLYAK